MIFKSAMVDNHKLDDLCDKFLLIIKDYKKALRSLDKNNLKSINPKNKLIVKEQNENFK